MSLVAALALLGGAVDLLAGVALLATPLFVIGIPLAAFGAVKCWVAVGLYRRRARALGLAVLLYGVGALVSAGRVVFAVGGGGDLAGPTGRLLLAIVVVGYLLVAADRFE